MQQFFKQLLSENNLDIDEEKQQKLLNLVDLLAKWNKTYNLTNITDKKDILIKHILDSIIVNKYLDQNEIIDVGTGPGFPGLPLAIINPDKQFYLLDSLGKRINFIKFVIASQNIKNVVAVLSRVEDFTDKKFDIVISRAFTNLDNMTNICQHLLKKDGKFLALKGLCDQKEIDSINKKFKINQIIDLKMNKILGNRHLIVINNK